MYCWARSWSGSGRIAPTARGETWRLLDAHRDQLEAWLDDEELTAVKVHELLERQGVVVPQRTLHALDELGIGRLVRSSTVPVADGKPGDELKVDFGKLGGASPIRRPADSGTAGR